MRRREEKKRRKVKKSEEKSRRDKKRKVEKIAEPIHINEIVYIVITFITINIIEMILHRKKNIQIKLVKFIVKSTKKIYVKKILLQTHSPERSLTFKSNNSFYLIKMISVTLSGSKCYFES